jgi:hypothetical protein
MCLQFGKSAAGNSSNQYNQHMNIHFNYLNSSMVKVNFEDLKLRPQVLKLVHIKICRKLTVWRQKFT